MKTKKQMKTKNKKPKFKETCPYPKTMEDAKKFCEKHCAEFGIKIYFDDKFKNFSGTLNQCCTGGDYVECSKFNDFNPDLLVFAVLHELGHVHYARVSRDVRANGIADQPDFTGNKNGFAKEYEAWNWAINEHNRVFARNINVKQGRFMLDCLRSYVPDYNSYRSTKWGKSERETSFWCPMNQKVLVGNCY